MPKETRAQLQSISGLPIPDPQTLPKDLQKYMSVCEDKLGMVPNVITYSAMISACEKGNQEWVLEVFDAMQRQGMVPKIIGCSAWISTCEKGRQPERALEIF